MSIDRSKLRADVKRLAKSREPARPMRVTAVIRDLLPEIERMRAEDHASWSMIAQALANQGLTEGVEKRPLSERRLTSIVTKLRRRNQAGTIAHDRADRSDVIAPPRPRLDKPRKTAPRLAPELSTPAPAPAPEVPLTEDDIRQAQREKFAHLFKKD